MSARQQPAHETSSSGQDDPSLVRLANGVAHHLNNIHQVLQGHAEHLLDRLPQGDPLRASAEAIAAAIDRATRLLSSLTAASGHAHVHAGRVDLNQFLIESRASLQRIAGDGLVIELDLEEGVGPAKIDRDRLQWMLEELVANAREATNGSGMLTLTTLALPTDAASKGRRVALKIIDRGRGMDAQTIEQALEPFFTTSARQGATGLGLAACAGLVRQAGGTLHLASTPGRGTTVTLTLPRYTAASADVPATQPGTGRTILLVDDEESTLHLLETVLARQGFTMLTARNGIEALDRIAQTEKPVDLIISDIQMPNMTGTELSRRLVARGVRVPTLFISGFTYDVLVDLGAIERGCEFVQKPFELKVLLEKALRLIKTESPGERSQPALRALASPSEPGQ